MAQSPNSRNTDAQRGEAYTANMKAAAGHFATAAEQLASKSGLQNESVYARAKSEGKMAPEVAGRDTLRKEAEGLRKDAGLVKDEAGAKKLGERIAKLDSSMQATAQHMTRPRVSIFSQDNGAAKGKEPVTEATQKALRTSLAPAIEQGRQAYAEASKLREPARSNTASNYKGAYKEEHKAVAGAERTARALASSEKLDKPTRDKYAAVADKLHKANDGIHDKASAKAAYKEAQGQMRAMAGDVKRATDKVAETKAGMKQYASVHKHHEQSAKVAKATSHLATAEVKSSKAQKEAKAASANVAEAAKPLGAAKAEVEAQQEKLKPLEAALKDASNKLAAAEKDFGKADSAVKAAQQKLEAVQAENKASLFGGLFGGKAKEEEAAKALAKAQDGLKGAEGRLTDARGKTETVLNSVEKAKGDLTQATEKLSAVEKTHAAAQAEATRLSAAAEAAGKARESAAAALTKLDGKAHKEPMPNAEKIAARAEAKAAPSPEKQSKEAPKEAVKDGKEVAAKPGVPSKEVAPQPDASKAKEVAPAKDARTEPAKADTHSLGGATRAEGPAAPTRTEAHTLSSTARTAESVGGKDARAEPAKADAHPVGGATRAAEGAAAKDVGGSTRSAAESSPVGQIRSTLASVEPNARLNKEGVTPLMVAARMGDAPMVKELLAKGADPSLKNAEGKTARDIAGSPEVAKAIESAARNLDNRSLAESVGRGAGSQSNQAGVTHSDSVAKAAPSEQRVVPTEAAAKFSDSARNQSASTGESQTFKVREDAAATRPAPGNTAPVADHSMSSAPESMFSGSSTRANAAPTAGAAQPALDTAKSFQSDSPAQAQQQPQQKSAERAAPEREMSR